MKQFSKSDKVRRMKNTGNFNDIIEDGIYTVESFESFDQTLYLKGYDYGVNSEYFELVVNVNDFNLETDSWFIRTPTPEITKLVQEWLFEKGFEWQFRKNEIRGHADVLINRGKTLFWCLGIVDENERHEIKFTFKNVMVVDKVEFPVKLTPEQIEIEQLERQINEAQERINQLKS